MYRDSLAGQQAANIKAISSAVAHQKKAENRWIFIIAAIAIALALFFIGLGCLVAKLTKSKKLTPEEKEKEEEK